jgi:hypothetical protein
MSELKVWYRPTLKLLDARATAQTDVDAAHVDPNNEGDISSWEHSHARGESTTWGGRQHRVFDS